MRIALFLGLIFFAAPSAKAEDLVINLKGAPLVLSNLQTHYTSKGPSGSAEFIYKFDLTNVSEQKVVAYSVAHLAIDGVGELAGPPNHVFKLFGVLPGKVRQDSWSLLEDSSNSPQVQRLQGFATGVSYVRRVRLEDGSIWIADMDEIKAILAKSDVQPLQ